MSDLGEVDLTGAIDVVAVMYDLGFDESVDEAKFWEARAVLGLYEKEVRAQAFEEAAKVAHDHRCRGKHCVCCDEIEAEIREHAKK